MGVVWVTGAHGFIGRHLARHLSDSAATVLGIGHGHWPDNEAERWGVRSWLNGSIGPANLGILASSGGLPNVVYHLAGGSSVGGSVRAPLEDFTRTVSAGAQLLDWLKKEAPAAAVVVVSSAAVYGAGHFGAIRTSASLRPFSPYGHHKFMLEELARSYADSFMLRSVVVRLFSVYGTGLCKQLLWDLCSRLAAGAERLQLAGDGGELRDWTEVSDVVRLLAQAGNLASVAVPVVNGGSGIATPVHDIASLVADAWGRSVAIEFSGVVRPGDPYSLVSTPCVIGAAPFAWEVPVAAGIRKYVDWFKKTCM